ncbi:MAG TPA: toast rack family protein [Bryobacteraceae bacterium]|nr:toast rack family protein [Bryobacteraceae bacterium]
MRVNLNMKAGELRLSGGATRFLEGSATYNIEGGKPVVKYASVAGRGNLTLDQPTVSATLGNAKCIWELRLPNDVPLDLAVDFGAGEAKLNAGSISLRSVEVRMGAGRLDMDLRGDPRRSYDVRVRGGVGEAVIRLPKNVGISAKATGGLGSINVTGLRKEGDHWINDAYDRAGRTIHVDVQGGIGEISLIAN